MNQPALLQAGESGASWPLPVPTIPSRSRLYRLEPRGRGTVLTESLTSYLNRLAWRHQVAPQRLVAQEIGPRLPQPLSFHQVACFSWSSAMGVNGNGPLARAWVTLLEDLTTGADLQLLTLAPWVGDLQPAKLLRAKPAWCAACYAQWKDEHLPLYEPLIWILQVVSLCMRHARPLEDQCPACQRKQSVIRSHTRLGQCAYCQTWLGAVAPPEAGPSPETLAWQRWVWQALEELRCAGTSSEAISWEPFFQQLRSGCATRGEQSRLADLAGLARGQLAVWLRRSHTPTFKSVLEFCYVCNVTPLQVLTGDLVLLKRVLQAGTPCRALRHDARIVPSIRNAAAHASTLFWTDKRSHWGMCNSQHSWGTAALRCATTSRRNAPGFPANQGLPATTKRGAGSANAGRNPARGPYTPCTRHLSLTEQGRRAATQSERLLSTRSESYPAQSLPRTRLGSRELRRALMLPECGKTYGTKRQNFLAKGTSA